MKREKRTSLSTIFKFFFYGASERAERTPEKRAEGAKQTEKKRLK
jgi:hypothetical protein